MRARYADEFRCSQCQREFQPYDTVMPKPSRRGGKAEGYNLPCCEALLIG